MCLNKLYTLKSITSWVHKLQEPCTGPQIWNENRYNVSTSILVRDELVLKFLGNANSTCLRAKMVLFYKWEVSVAWHVCDRYWHVIYYYMWICKTNYRISYIITFNLLTLLPAWPLKSKKMILNWLLSVPFHVLNYFR